MIVGRKNIIRLDRKWFTNLSTIGELFMPGAWTRICYTLEDTVRAPGVKVQDETAIPEGTYEMVLSFSDKFKQMMPLLLAVPNFSGIRFHKGNQAKDTRGCILTGMSFDPRVNPNLIANSADAYDHFRLNVDPLFQIGKVFCTIKNIREIDPQTEIPHA